jgi:hypothetical protein
VVSMLWPLVVRAVVVVFHLFVLLHLFLLALPPLLLLSRRFRPSARRKGHVVVGVMVGIQPGERRSQPSSARAAHVTWSSQFELVGDGDASM